MPIRYQRSVRSVFAVTVVTLGACGLFDADAALVQLSAIAAPSARLGDSVAVRVVLENKSDVPITFQGNTCPRFFRVASANGEDAGPPYQTVGCLAYSMMISVEPRGRHEYVGYWHARAHGPRFEPIVVRPGRYRIEPVLLISDTAGGRRVAIRRAISTITVID